MFLTYKNTKAALLLLSEMVWKHFRQTDSIAKESCVFQEMPLTYGFK